MEGELHVCHNGHSPTAIGSGMSGTTVAGLVRPKQAHDALPPGIESLLGRLDRVATAVEHNNRLLTRSYSPYVPVRTSGVVPSGGGNLALDLGSPDRQFHWDVRIAIVCGVNWGIAVAGTAELYVFDGPINQIAASDNIRDPDYLVDEAASLPAVSGYILGQVQVHAGQHLGFVVVGGTAGQYYRAVARVQQWSDSEPMVEIP